MIERRRPLPPFTRQSAIQSVDGAAGTWNSRHPERVATADGEDSASRPASPRELDAN